MPEYATSQSVRVGKETFEVSQGKDDLFGYARALTNLRKMARLVTPRSELRHREVDPHQYLEFYSPELRAAKKLSEEQQPKDRDFPFYISWDTPWILIKRQDGGYIEFAMWDNDGAAQKNGFPQGKVWYEIERVKEGRGKDERTVLKQIGEGNPCTVDYRLG